jgi:hypothetical protein
VAEPRYWCRFQFGETRVLAPLLTHQRITLFLDVVPVNFDGRITSTTAVRRSGRRSSPAAVSGKKSRGDWARPVRPALFQLLELSKEMCRARCSMDGRLSRAHQALPDLLHFVAFMCWREKGCRTGECGTPRCVLEKTTRALPPCENQKKPHGDLNKRRPEPGGTRPRPPKRA